MSAERPSWQAVFSEALDRAHLATPEQVVALVDDAAASLGVAVEVYLTDLGQRELRPVRDLGGAPLDAEGSPGGHAFTRVEITAVRDGDRAALWVPVLDGTERLGVARVALPAGTDPADPDVRRHGWTLASLIAHLVVSKQHYGDRFHRVRRAKPLSVASELLWQLLPPAVFACDRAVVAALMEPYDQVGGDGYDYAVDDDHAYVAVFDAMGHDLPAGLTTSIALAATRNARRSGAGLLAAADLADRNIAGHRQGALMPFATAFLARLDLETGELEHLSAGHPPPAVVRDGRVVRMLEGGGRTPLGMGPPSGPPTSTSTTRLEPGDRVLFYTDGVTEARDPHGVEFGLDRLAELIEHHERAGLPAPETLRRVMRAVLDHQHGKLQDDATLLMLEWTTTGQARLLPEP
ncbi:PP2C family protein-serine/threonine phosphatase [Actinokineospora bangkokensis]|uniref:Serine/threonine protein phosphatase n=1 Tax=Actinokineospora bangkokensis TaxID=1193682 RepID=A0A1Q9LMM9_9PSEU|nr:PP2C family protein-serine/threonine phosphatase [Actinokineospora bangkokensis]OLR93244.1 serine/threonine protein phosphatase [Actinokineospora bangkokensis]